MKIRLLLFVLFLCFASLWASAAATVKVTDIQMQKSSQFTDVTIVCDGAADFTHQIVEATANKPYRIVVDVKDAVNALSQLSFKDLPSGSIKQIRTSQYATDPEKVVRIVFDVAGTLTYKIKGDGNTFSLQINTPSDKDFPRWSAVTAPSAPTLAVAKPEAPAKAEVASKPEVAKTTAAPVTPTQTPTVAATQAPKPMPAHPDNPATPPQATAGATETKEVKLAAKPIDESKLLTKVSKPVAAAETESKPQQPAKTETAAPPAAPATDKTSSAPDKAAKRVDSVALPQLKPTPTAPATEPSDAAKPPKSEKTALPETKVVKTPTYTESPEAGNALTGEIATAMTGSKAATKVSEPQSQEDSTAAETTLSKSEEVRMRYLAGRKKATAAADETTEGTTTADAAAPQTPPSKIDKIRMKYKRGITFVQNDEDEEQQAYSEADQEEFDQNAAGVGPYSEFLPEREIIVYQTSGLLDPFMPLIEEAAASAQGGELPDVETLRLVGILQDKKSSRALFQDYNNYSYILRTGDRVKNGFVLSIEETRVLFQIRQYGWNRQVAIDLESEK